MPDVNTPIRIDLSSAGVVELVLNSPATGNALTLESCRQLQELVASLIDRREVRCVLLRSEGRAFSVGGALNDFAAADNPEQLLDGMAEALHSALIGLRSLAAPIVVAVQGAAAGAGLGLAAVGDLVFAGRAASFTWAYTAVGLSGDGGTTWLLPRLIGLRHTQELAFENRRLSAEEAAAIGLVTRIVEDAELLQIARGTAERLANGPTDAYGAVKRLLDTSLETTFGLQLDREKREIAALAATPDGREGVSAFLERRAPRFGLDE